MDDSYMDDRYFYNPLNSLSHSEANESLNAGKYSTINQNPVVLARQANTIDIGPVIDKINTSSIPVAPQLSKKESSFKGKPQETLTFQSDTQQILDLKMPSLKQIPNARTVMNSQRSPMDSGKLLADIIEVAPRRLKIFDDVNTSTLVSEKSQLFKLNPLHSLNTSLVDVVIESKPVHSFEDLLVQKSMFLTTKFTEATINEFLLKAQTVIQQVQPLKEQYNTLLKVYDRVWDFRNLLQTNLDESMDKVELKELKLDFKIFYDEMLSLECITNVPNMDQSKQILDDRFNTIQQLEIAMKNLLELRKDIKLLQTNQHFIAQFYNNLDLLKITNRFVKFEGNNLINSFTSFLKHETLQLAYEIS